MEAIIGTAARRIRERDFNAVVPSDVRTAAGLTHGAFYGHFASKEGLAVTAVAAALRTSWPTALGGGGLGRIGPSQHGDLAGEDCPLYERRLPSAVA